MPDSTTQPNTEHTEIPNETTATPQEQSPAELSPQPTPSAPIIWTPSFIITFTLTLAIGLSVESLLTQGWLNNDYPGEWILLGHLLLVCFGCIAIIILARSWWLRIGGISGFLWSLFMSINLIVGGYSHFLDTNSAVTAYLNVASSLLLLGAYICFSTYRVPLRRWDTGFFVLALVGGSCAVILMYLLAPAANRSPGLIENDVARVALMLGVLTWWIRPSCWKTQPGPTFLFGLVPLFLLLLSTSIVVGKEANFFFSQVLLLIFILGAMRTAQSAQCELYN